MAKCVNPLQPKTRAVCVVYSWMRAWGVDVRMPAGPDEGDIVVSDKRIIFNEERQSSDYDFALAASAILGADLRDTITELHRLTTFLGRGTPAGFRQVAGNGTKRASRDDYLGLSMRLTPFGRTPNIPVDDILKHTKTLKREADRAGRRGRYVLANMGLDRDDLYNIGLVFVTNYLNRHQSLSNEKQNGANLTLFLHQEYGRWFDVTVRHLKNTAPVTSGVPIEYLMGAPCPNAIFEDSHGTDKEAAYCFDLEKQQQNELPSDPVFTSINDEEKYMRKKATKEERYLAKRRRNAKVLLDTSLAEMPHDRMVTTLQDVASSEFQHPDARKEANRRLNEHFNSCTSCKTSLTKNTLRSENKRLSSLDGSS
jgi:hypothetical protein